MEWFNLHRLTEIFKNCSRADNMWTSILLPDLQGLGSHSLFKFYMLINVLYSPLYIFKNKYKFSSKVQSSRVACPFKGQRPKASQPWLLIRATEK